MTKRWSSVRSGGDTKRAASKKARRNVRLTRDTLTVALADAYFEGVEEAESGTQHQRTSMTFATKRVAHLLKTKSVRLVP